MKLLKITGPLLGVGTGLFLGAAVASKIGEATNNQIESSRDKFKQYYDITRELLKLYNKGIVLDEYFRKNKINRFAIYGAGTMGDMVYNCLGDNTDKIAFYVEETGNNIDEYIGNIPLKTLECGVSFVEIDMVVVTAVSYYRTIKENLKNSGCECEIVSLEDIVYALSE